MDSALQKSYMHALEKLSELSLEEIANLAPDAASQQELKELVYVLVKASKGDLAQAEFKQRVEKLGDLVSRISKRFSGLGSIFLT